MPQINSNMLESQLSFVKSGFMATNTKSLALNAEVEFTFTRSYHLICTAIQITVKHKAKGFKRNGQEPSQFLN